MRERYFYEEKSGSDNFIFLHFVLSDNIDSNCNSFWDAVFDNYNFVDFIRSTHHTKAKK